MDLFERLIDASATLEWAVVDEGGAIVEVNGAFAGHVGTAVDELAGRPLAEFLPDPDAGRLRGWLGEVGPPPDPVRVNFVTTSGVPYTLRCLIGRSGEPVPGLRIVGEPETEGDRTAAEELLRLNNELATLARERARQQRELERTKRKLSDAFEELRTSYWHLRKIQEVLPVCMKCGRVKGDGSEWQTVVDYLKDNEIFLSHGYCPPCAEEAMREMGLEE